jgi:hypothetical protein
MSTGMSTRHAKRQRHFEQEDNNQSNITFDGIDVVDDFGPMIPSLSGEVDPMEADLHSRRSISAVHELEVAAYGSHGWPPGDQSDEIRALVQTCHYQVGSNHARGLRMEETHLCSRWQLSMKHGASQDEVRVKVPELYFVSAKDLKSPVLVFEESPALCESWQGKHYV